MLNNVCIQTSTRTRSKDFLFGNIIHIYKKKENVWQQQCSIQGTARKVGKKAFKNCVTLQCKLAECFIVAAGVLVGFKLMHTPLSSWITIFSSIFSYLQIIFFCFPLLPKILFPQLIVKRAYKSCLPLHAIWQSCIKELLQNAGN